MCPLDQRWSWGLIDLVIYFIYHPAQPHPHTLTPTAMSRESALPFELHLTSNQVSLPYQFRPNLFLYELYMRLDLANCETLPSNQVGDVLDALELRVADRIKPIDQVTVVRRYLLTHTKRGKLVMFDDKHHNGDKAALQALSSQWAWENLRRYCLSNPSGIDQLRDILEPFAQHFDILRSTVEDWIRVERAIGSIHGLWKM